MAYLGLVPSEHSSGNTVHRGSITRTGNGHVRRVLVEAAWTYKMRARKTLTILKRQVGLSKSIQDISWKAQSRLCARYQRLFAKGKSKQTIITAIARELSAFIWAIDREVQQTWPEYKNTPSRLIEGVQPRWGGSSARLREFETPVGIERGSSTTKTSQAVTNPRISAWSTVVKVFRFLKAWIQFAYNKTFFKKGGTRIFFLTLSNISADIYWFDCQASIPKCGVHQEIKDAQHFYLHSKIYHHQMTQ